MVAIIASVGSLIAGISLIQLANGYVGTLIGVRLAAAEVPPVITGIVMSAYFAGYVTGAVLCHRLIARAGHIRAFAALAALVAAAFLGYTLSSDPLLWIPLRAITGFGCAGLFVATESWLNAKTSPAARAQVFAIYMVATYTTFGGSQFVLNLPAPGGFELFVLAAILFCLALVLVATTRAEAPQQRRSTALRFGELAGAAPVALAGCFVGGIITGAFYGLVPVYGVSSGRSVFEISCYMSLAIFGGLLLQVPVARLSDRIDRRLVAGLMALGFAVLTQLLGAAARTHVFFLFWLLLGGFMSVIYPICVAHANDRMPAERAVAVSGRLILISGIGSVLGPLLGSTVMAEFGIRGLFSYMGVVAGLFAVFALARGASVRAPKHRRRAFLLIQSLFAHDLAHATTERAADPGAGDRPLRSDDRGAEDEQGGTRAVPKSPATLPAT